MKTNTIQYRIFAVVLLGLFCICGFAEDTSHNLYYVFANPNNYTIKANGKLQSDNDSWKQWVMSQSDKTYNGTPIYTTTITVPYEGLATLQFQQYNGDNWQAQVVPFENTWTGSSVWSGKMYTGSAWVDYAYDVAIKYESNGATGTVSSTTGLNTETLTIAAADGLTYTGYVFNGWNTSATGGGTSYTAGQTTTISEDLTLYAQWVEDTKEYTVTIANDGNGTTNPSGEITVQKDATVSITATANTGYAFKEWTVTGGATVASATTATTTISATAAGSVTATFVPVIYFKNTLEWSEVYAYLFSNNAWWEDNTGVHPATNKITAGQMTRLGESNVYYFPLSTDCQYVAFSETDMTTFEKFYQSNAVYRGDKTDAVNMFIPDPDQTPSVTNENNYYNEGVWMCYSSTASGYYLTGTFNTWSKTANPFTAANANTYTFTTTVALSAATSYTFKLYRTYDNSNYFYGSSATITQTNRSDIAFDSNTDATITTTSAGDYVFTLTFNEGKLLLSVEYPVSTGDYRLAYREGAESAPTKFHPAHALRQNTTATAAAPTYDTVSFFVDKTATSPAILLQQCTEVSGTEPTWTTRTTYAVSSISPITATGVYNFIVQQDGSSATLQTDQTHAYTGNYYIRTDVASGGWNDYRSSTNRMTYSDYAHSNGENFDYYYCAWVLTGRNVKYTVANAYSECVSDTLAGDDITGTTNELCPANANIRYAWNSQTNALSRAYIDGAGESETEFLVLHGNTTDDAAHIYTATDGDAQSAITFADKGNWVYQIDIYANPNALVKLTAQYNTNTQYLKGAEGTTFSEDDYTIIGGSTTDSDTKYQLRVVYDFKTNHLVGAWLPSGEITTTEVINANMMIVRNHQEDATQITFNGDEAQLTQVQTVYGVLTFDKTTLNDESLSEYARALYWISFPFDVSLNEVFGFGEYGKHWILQYYDGAERAEKGLWKEAKYSYWKYVSESERKDFVLKANMGYVVGLDLSRLTTSSSVFANTDQVALYFPSQQPVSTVKQQDVTVTLDAYACTNTRDSRNIYDSNWHLMGVPSFADNTLAYSSDSEDEKVGFYYEWNATTNGFTVQKTGSTAFKAMNAYMVQYTGDIKWTAVSGVVQSLAARRSPSYDPQTYTLRLQLLANGNAIDQTYIQWQEEGATSGFDFNLDLAKTVNNKGSNLYSLIGVDSIQAAANVLPLDDVQTVVPIGLYCSKAGDYTFSLPDGMEGWMPVLVDNETHTTTNLLLSDYTVHLTAGTHNNRFVLRLQGCTTGSDTQSVENGEDTTQKLLINGHLYIRQGNRLYDVLGR